mmetsp:Transcript_27529/g.66239  ORF Transcript_27529/g.66239 Transcript_27529/m.66239 type:complete len:270 (-) Transcript_27529:719-1528(-)
MLRRDRFEGHPIPIIPKLRDFEQLFPFKIRHFLNGDILPVNPVQRHLKPDLGVEHFLDRIKSNTGRGLLLLLLLFLLLFLAIVRIRIIDHAIRLGRKHLGRRIELLALLPLEPQDSIVKTAAVQTVEECVRINSREQEGEDHVVLDGQLDRCLLLLFFSFACLFLFFSFFCISLLFSFFCLFLFFSFCSCVVLGRSSLGFISCLRFRIPILDVGHLLCYHICRRFLCLLFLLAFNFPLADIRSRVCASFVLLIVPPFIDCQCQLIHIVQ